MENKGPALERIVERCKKNYINILPHSNSKKHEPLKAQIRGSEPRKELSRAEIHQLLGQLNVVLQLLVQNYVLAKNR